MERQRTLEHQRLIYVAASKRALRASQTHVVPQYAGFYRALAFYWACASDREGLQSVYWGSHAPNAPRVNPETYWTWATP